MNRWAWAGVGVIVATVGGWLFVTRDATATPTEALGAPRFIEETASGIDHRYDGEFTFFVGGGIAAFDCNDDRLLDLYAAGGANPGSLYRNVSSPGGSLRFQPVSDAVTDLVDVTGAYPIDIDSDSVTDLVLTRLGENVVLRGLGDCRFQDARDLWRIDGGEAWTVGFSAVWEEGETLPTLAFGNYIRLDENGQQFGGCEDNVLIRPDVDGYRDAILLAPGWCTLSILFSDWDRSGRTDLRATNDRHYYRDGEEQMWRGGAGGAPRPFTRDEGGGKK